MWDRAEHWDKLLGLYHIRLDHFNEENDKLIDERWIRLDSELIFNRQGQIARTCQPTEHLILIRTSIEFPKDLSEDQSKEFYDKFDFLHEILHQQVRQC